MRGSTASSSSSSSFLSSLLLLLLVSLPSSSSSWLTPWQCTLYTVTVTTLNSWTVKLNIYFAVVVGCLALLYYTVFLVSVDSRWSLQGHFRSSTSYSQPMWQDKLDGERCSRNPVVKVIRSCSVNKLTLSITKEKKKERKSDQCDLLQTVTVSP